MKHGRGDKTCARMMKTYGVGLQKDIARSCTSKTRYDTEKRAKRALERRRKYNRRRGIDVTLRIYLCEICDGWHRTKRPLPIEEEIPV